MGAVHQVLDADADAAAGGEPGGGETARVPSARRRMLMGAG